MTTVLLGLCMSAPLWLYMFVSFHCLYEFELDLQAPSSLLYTKKRWLNWIHNENIWWLQSFRILIRSHLNKHTRIHETNGRKRWKCCLKTSYVCHNGWILLRFLIHVYSECYVSSSPIALWWKKGIDVIVRVYVRWAGLIATAVHKPRYSLDDF